MTHNFIRNFIVSVLLVATIAVAELPAQDRLTVNQEIRLARGVETALVSKRIRRGTTHIYRVRARANQQMAVVLKTGNQTSLTVSNRHAGILEGADGVRRIVITLPKTGVYEIQIGTDATANYTLEVTIN